jgi:hypothetical protein
MQLLNASRVGNEAWSNGAIRAAILLTLPCSMPKAEGEGACLV